MILALIFFANLDTALKGLLISLPFGPDAVEQLLLQLSDPLVHLHAKLFKFLDTLLQGEPFHVLLLFLIVAFFLFVPGSQGQTLPQADQPAL